MAAAVEKANGSVLFDRAVACLLCGAVRLID
jgi:hypothetical protein